jgi:hypothetical protein
MKQTAVEWLEEQITKKDCGELPMYVYNAIEKAMEMEKEQIKKAWIDGNYNIDSNGKPSQNYAISDEKYYKQTFKSE